MNFLEFRFLFFPDQKLVRKKYLENSRKLHPDFAHGKDEVESMELIALNNKAYATLISQDKLIDYILNELFPSSKKATLPPEFLMEMMETNESLMEYKLMEDDIALGKVKDEVSVRIEEIKQTLKRLIMDFNFSNLDKLAEVRNLDLKLNYLNRIMANS